VRRIDPGDAVADQPVRHVEAARDRMQVVLRPAQGMARLVADDEECVSRT
jgi:hypothetical protein